MKFKSPTSLQSWLFLAGAVSLILMGLVFAVATILAAHGQGLQTLIEILEFIGFSFLILASLVSIFRSILPAKPK